MIEVKRADAVKVGDRINVRRGEQFANVTGVRTVAMGTGVEIRTDAWTLPWMHLDAEIAVYHAGDPMFG